MTAEDIGRLGRYVRDRRAELDMNQLEVAEAGGPSNSTLTGLETGHARAVSSSTLRKLDRALLWDRGSARRVLEGGEPKSVTDAEAHLQRMADAARETPVDNDYAAVDELPGTTAAQREAIKAMLRGWRGSDTTVSDQRRRAAGES